MTDNNIDIPWAHFFKQIKKMIKGFEIPYVSEFSQNHTGDRNPLAFKVLISTIISLRTKDQVTSEATVRLFKLAKTPKTMGQLDVKLIEKTIYPAGFYRVKAKNIIKTCHILVDTYQGRVPDDIDKLTSFPGVGRKTANLVMTEGFDKHAICVDTHVHRILNRFKYVNTKTPDDTEMRLREILPKRYWKHINYWLVCFGQNHCKPVGPKCGSCILFDDCQWEDKFKKLKNKSVKLNS
ncbi:hypothetical protein BVY03_03080 [bacterium K02(2017)]|nr:hypothetical protein BVY03_03080 [bacterium K02(2017)]